MSDSAADNEKAMPYFQKYLAALVQRARPFVFLRQAVSKISHLESGKQYPCSYTPQDKSLHVKVDDADKAFPLENFEKIQWQEVSGASGKLKYIQITLKGDRNPLILHGPTEIMELWYDALFSLKSETGLTYSASSKAKIEVFGKAVHFAAIRRKNVIEIPPPPTDYNFVAQFPPD
jgi:hypothetical protein